MKKQKTTILNDIILACQDIIVFMEFDANKDKRKIMYWDKQNNKDILITGIEALAKGKETEMFVIQLKEKDLNKEALNLLGYRIHLHDDTYIEIPSTKNEDERELFDYPVVPKERP